MKTRMLNSSLSHLRIIIAGMLMVFALAMLSGTAAAGTVTFSYSDSCEIGISGCFDTGHLFVSRGTGLTSLEKGVPVATVESNLHSSVTVTGGQLKFESAPATRSFYDPPKTWYGWYDLPGGAGTIKGDVFGLGSGSLLLTISQFLPGGTSLADYCGFGPCEVFGATPFEGDINATVLSSLGLNPAFTHGYGVLYDEVDVDFHITTVVGVTFTQSPEPASLALFGSGVLGLGGFLRRRLLG